MKTVQNAINSLRLQLNNLYDNQEAEAITLMVLSDITGFSKAKLKAFGDEPLSDIQQNRIDAITAQLSTGMPVQYALGHAHFFGLDFKVTPATLIPRPETEELVNWVIESARSADLNILDIGTGSGCIAISLKHELKQANVSAMDISADALNVARKNAVDNDCDIRFTQGDILNWRDLTFEHKFDIIVSNPPYVTSADKLQMHHNVTGFEPHTALFVPQDEPLLFYAAIADFSKANLHPGGSLYFEINESYAEQTIELLKYKLFINIALKKDIRGKDRMIKATGSTANIQADQLLG